MADTQNTQVAIPLPENKRKCVQAGCICMMLSVAMYGLVFATLTSPILESVNAMGYVGLFSIFSALGLSIMTPIGGKLGDLIGRRKIRELYVQYAVSHLHLCVRLFRLWY